MESKESPSEQLHQVERLQAAPWLEYPPTPNWYFPVVGLWFGAITVSGVNMLDSSRWIPAVVALLAFEVVFVVWMHRRRGATPNLRVVPTEFKPVVKWFALIGTLIAGITLTLAFAGLDLVALVVGGALATVGLYVYEQKFEAAAVDARARLQIA